MYESSAPLLTEPAPAVTAWRPRESAVVVGTAVVDITPPVGIRAHNWGASRTGQATGVHRPLTASALAVADGEGWRYLVTADLGWWQSVAVYRSVFEPVAAELGVDDHALLLHLIHTHAGPSLAEADPELPGGELVEPYRAALVAALVKACRAARESAAPSTITWSYGRCDVAAVRDLPCGDREIVGFDPSSSDADDTVAVARIADAGGRTTGVLFNYACHPTTLAHENSLLSPDYVGAARETVTVATGAPALFFQGASGELAPREQYTPGTDLADRHGRALGHAVLSALETMPAPASALRYLGTVESGAPLAVWHAEPEVPPAGTAFVREALALPCRGPADEAELRGRWAHIDPLAAQERLARSARLSEGYRAGDTAQHPVWVWQLGDAVVVAHPGEAYSPLQTELRRRHPARVVFVLNLTNGPGFMYLPPAGQYAKDSYQVWQTLVAEGGLEMLIDHADALIAALPAPRPVLA